MHKVFPSGGHGATLDQMWVGECETQDATCVALLRTAASGFLNGKVKDGVLVREDHLALLLQSVKASARL